MKCFLQSALILISVFFVAACSKEDPNPELRDPIWADLVKLRDDHQKKLEESTAKYKDLRERLEKAEVGSLDKRDIERDLVKTRAAILSSEQWARYYKIRADRRKIVDKMAYQEAFYAKKEWPYPGEYSEYQINRRVSEINLNWNVRVPKLSNRTPASAKKEEKKGEEKKDE